MVNTNFSYSSKLRIDEIFKNFFLFLIISFTLSIILTGCGSSSSSTSTTITAVDGYIKNAIVKDNLGQVATYSINGKYTFSSSPTYPLTLNGGSLEDTNASFDINMTVSDGTSKVISPITTFLGTNDALRGKLTNAGFTNFTSIADFAVDYVENNDTNLSKLSQLLYTILRDANLTATFKTSIENNTSLTSLDTMFTLASRDINNSTILTSIEKLRINSLLNKTKSFTDSASNMEIFTKVYKLNLNTTATITHKGITYGTVTSPYTGRIWLDRNLGASEICTKSRRSFSTNGNYNISQQSCYGDYYQWGREDDGHQESNSTITTNLATTITSVGNSFIKNFSSPYDWLDVNNNNVDDNGSLRSAKWSKTDGTSICPVGFRVPTEAELTAETTGLNGADDVTNRDGAFNNFLKLPSAGIRRRITGSLYYQGSYGRLWTSSVDGSDSRILYFSGGGAVWVSNHRDYGLSVRCVRD